MKKMKGFASSRLGLQARMATAGDLQALGVHVHGMRELRRWGMCPSVRGWSVILFISNRSELVHSLALHNCKF